LSDGDGDGDGGRLDVEESSPSHRFNYTISRSSATI
jgi:hypothetical protein